MISKKRTIAITIGILIIILLLIAVAYFSGITRNAVTDSVIGSVVLGKILKSKKEVKKCTK